MASRAREDMIDPPSRRVNAPLVGDLIAPTSQMRPLGPRPRTAAGQVAARHSSHVILRPGKATRLKGQES
jgi:hypothetical protein